MTPPPTLLATLTTIGTEATTVAGGAHVSAEQGRQVLEVVERVRELEALICHMEIHSACSRCGFRQMTTEQKHLFASITTR